MRAGSAGGFSLLLRLFLGFLLITLVLCAFIIYLSHQTVRQTFTETTALDLYRMAVGMRSGVEEAMSGDSLATASVDSLADALGSEMNIRITVVDVSGAVLGDTYADPAEMESHRGRPEIIWALRSGMGSSQRYSTTLEEDLLYVAIPISGTAGRPAVLRLSLRLTSIEEVMASLTGRVIRSTAIFAVAALVVALAFSRSLSRPVRDMVRATRSAASGDFGVRVLPSSIREMSELGRSFNRMIERTGRVIGELSAEKEKLGTVISSMREGLLVLDRNGKASIWNRAFEEIVGCKPSAGDPFRRFVSDPDLYDLLGRAISGAGKEDTELGLGGRTYVCRSSRIPASSEIIVTLYDVTELTGVLRMKKDFVANVSHELRTPLTAIKGFAETLSGAGLDAESSRYVGIIESNADRLISLVRDLQVLSELETRGSIQDPAPVDLRDVARDAVAMFQQKALVKGLELRLDAGEDVSPVSGDAFRLAQVFVNLLDNALSYTEKGSIVVRVYSEGSDRVVAEVADTGIGIPEEERGRIFERFYVVDRSRSRQQGGTGLGLSIVKHIVVLHGGSVEVADSPGKGSLFRVALPAAPSTV
ncbi:HAMP domain-containing protein [Candidatus Fermentibacterales bacterium]|nr:HAMP domain-containing protein [Candidatus Fermentibacterales bacterium]